MSYRNLAETLGEQLPAILWRHRWDHYREQFGVPFARGSMQNMDYLGRGPRMNRAGSRVYYTREDFLAWLNGLDDSSRGEAA